jgi:hypothetical protein
MASVGVRVGPTVRLWRVGTALHLYVTEIGAAIRQWPLMIEAP